jgi:UDP-N-acetylglucosamine:LPS N-acetylglucosamine transferase
MKRIALVYFDAGGGHRNAAMALQQVLEQAGLSWEVQLVNLQEILDSIDIVRQMTGLRIQDAYNRMLQNGWTLGSPQLMRVLQALIWLYHPKTVRLLQKFWAGLQPDLVASLVPHFNRALCESLRKASPGKPFVTILTDFADYPPHFWIERQEQFFICGSERAAQQARELGHPGERIFRTSGMILNPRFYNYTPVDRAAERVKSGLEAERMTALVLFGGQGARKKMLDIDRRLSESGLPIQLILICGKNERLRNDLLAETRAIPRVIEGFTTNVPYYMQLADFFIGKPGPGSIAEALAMGLPVIIERNAWTLPQERYNAVWVREKQVGLVLANFDTVVASVTALLDEHYFARFRCNAKKMNNRALFEIPDILSRILRQSNL